MSLADNREYETADRKARTLLARHTERIRELQAQGLTRKEASEQAFRELSKRKDTNQRDQCII